MQFDGEEWAVTRSETSGFGHFANLDPFEQLNEYSVRIGRNNRSNRPEGLRLFGQKDNASFPKIRRCRIDISHAKR